MLPCVSLSESTQAIHVPCRRCCKDTACCRLQVKAALEDQYAGKAANDTVGALAALLKDSPRVNPRKGAPVEAFASVPQVGHSCSSTSA